MTWIVVANRVFRSAALMFANRDHPNHPIPQSNDQKHGLRCLKQNKPVCHQVGECFKSRAEVREARSSAWWQLGGPWSLEGQMGWRCWKVRTSYVKPHTWLFSEQSWRCIAAASLLCIDWVGKTGEWSRTEHISTICPWASDAQVIQRTSLGITAVTPDNRKD